MPASVQVDTSKFDRGVRQLSDGITRGAPDAARKSAEQVAARLRDLTPRDTGKLADSIAVVVDGDGGFGVAYGAGLRYARPVAARTGNVADAISGRPEGFAKDCEQVAADQVRRL